jgi:transcriptional regulator with XRE-family HTH domain
MPRPQLPPELDPRQPRTLLGWSMQKFRIVHGWTGKDVARATQLSASHISRVEQGKNRPSRALVQFYEDTFGADGLLLSLFEVVAHAGEERRQRAVRSRRRMPLALPGDASTFLWDTVPHGTALVPGAYFLKSWCVRNSGTVTWRDRGIERQGPLTGPGLITSLRWYPVPDTEPGHEVLIHAVLKAPTYECSSIAYFKQVGADGALCFPDRHQVGLDVLVRVLA